MSAGGRGPSILRAEWIALAAIALLFVVVRLPLLREPGLFLGWNSDAAVFGLMAKAISEGRELPVFFWGQSYMGPLTAFVTAAAGVFVGVGPLALRIAAMLETACAIILYWLALRRAFDRRVAAVVALWLAIGPAFLFRFTIAPIGAEQMFLLSALIFWVSMRFFSPVILSRQSCGAAEPAQDDGDARARRWFLFGLLAGLGWWMNQGVVFALGATLIVLVLRSEAWALAWPYPHAADRILMRIGRLQWRGLDRATRWLLQGINLLLLAALAAGVIHELVPQTPAFFLFHPILEPLLAWIAYRTATALAFDRETRAALSQLRASWRSWLPTLAALAAGALLGYAPVIIGGFLHAYPRSYGLSVPMLDAPDMLRHVALLARDLPALIGAGGGAAFLVAILIVPLALAIIRERNEAVALVFLRSHPFGPRAIAAMTIVLGFLFYVTSARAHPGSVRYIASALPMLYAFAAEEVLRWRWRLASPLVALLVAVGLLMPRIAERNEVTAGAAEDYAHLGGAFDPRPAIRAIESEGYRVCYANYWIAYKLEWLSGSRVEFIPFHSYDRTPERSKQLAAQPGPKCYVDEKGAVRLFNPLEWDESTSSEAKKRLHR